MKIKKTIAAALTVVMLSTAASGYLLQGQMKIFPGELTAGAEETQRLFRG